MLEIIKATLNSWDYANVFPNLNQKHEHEAADQTETAEGVMTSSASK